MTTATIAHPFFGEVSCEEGASWQQTVTVNGRALTLSLLVFEPPSREQLDLLASLARDVERLDRLARAELAAKVTDDSSVGMYIAHHRAELTERGLQAAFGTTDRDALTPEAFLPRMVLARMNLWPSSQTAVLDYTLDHDVTQYLLAVTFDAMGIVTSVSMES